MRKRCCCNCKHCERVKEMVGKHETINTYCDLDNHYIGYVECFDGWCRRWAKSHKFDEEET